MKQCYYCDGEYNQQESESNHKNMFCSMGCEELYEGYIFKDGE